MLMTSVRWRLYRSSLAERNDIIPVDAPTRRFSLSTKCRLGNDVLGDYRPLGFNCVAYELV